MNFSFLLQRISIFGQNSLKVYDFKKAITPQCPLRSVLRIIRVLIQKYGHCLKSQNQHTFARTKAVKTVYGLVIAVPADLKCGTRMKRLVKLPRFSQFDK